MEVASAEGWYRDPYRLHEDRWMSQGRPTKLVRDGGTEAYDPPPDLPLPGDLVPVAADRAFTGGSDLRRADEVEREADSPDLRRADEAEEGPPHSDERAGQAALDAIAGGAVIDEPGDNW